MRNSIRNASRGIFGGLVVAGLGFGAGQAFASPELTRGRYVLENRGGGMQWLLQRDVRARLGRRVQPGPPGVNCGCTQLIIDP